MNEFCKNLVALSVWTALVRRPMRKTMRINEESLPRLRSDFFPTRRIPGQSTRATLGLNPALRVPARASGANLELRPGNGVGGAAVGVGWNGRKQNCACMLPGAFLCWFRAQFCLSWDRGVENKSVKISAVFSRMAVFWKKLCAGDT